MDFSFETQGANTFLVYRVSGDDTLDTMSLGMLTNNKIAGFAPTLFTQMDTEKYIKYNVTSRVKAKQFFSGTVNKKRLIGVFMGIVNAMMSAEDYMIDTNNIILDLDYMFTDVSNCDTVLVCLPIICDDLSKQDLGTFFKNIMFTTQFDQTENCDHVAKIMNFLNSSPVFSLVDFKRLLDNIEKAQSTQPQVKPAQQASKQTVSVQQPVITKASQTQSVQKSVQQEPAITPPPVLQPQSQVQQKKKSFLGNLFGKNEKKNTAVSQPVTTTKKSQPQPNFAVPGAPSNVGFAVPGQPVPASISAQQPSAQQKAVPTQQTQTRTPVSVANAQQPVATQPSTPQSKPMSFGETTVLGGGNIGETTVLNAGAQQKQAITPHLIRSKNNERIMIDKPVYRIGKEKSYVDYFIGDNTAISRSHANIVTRDGKYYIVDTNSTNHTYVDGSMIQSNSEVEISHGTKIRLANEDFIFNLY